MYKLIVTLEDDAPLNAIKEAICLMHGVNGVDLLSAQEETSEEESKDISSVMVKKDAPIDSPSEVDKENSCFVEEEYVKQYSQYTSKIWAYFMNSRHKIQDRVRPLMQDFAKRQWNNMMAGIPPTIELPREDIHCTGCLIGLDEVLQSDMYKLSEEELQNIKRSVDLNSIVILEDQHSDIGVFLSKEPTENKNQRFDIVFTELKRVGFQQDGNASLEAQLMAWSRAFLQYYGDRVKQISFYEFGDLNGQFQNYLKNKGFELETVYGKVCSHSQLFYGEGHKVATNLNINVIDFAALFLDVHSHNVDILNLLNDKYSRFR